MAVVVFEKFTPNAKPNRDREREVFLVCILEHCKNYHHHHHQYYYYYVPSSSEAHTVCVQSLAWKGEKEKKDFWEVNLSIGIHPAKQNLPRRLIHPSD